VNTSPSSEAEFLAAATRVLARGKYRVVYDAPSLGAVIKIPQKYTPQAGDEAWADPLVHARKEIATLHEIHTNPSLLHLRRYTPHVFFSNPETGVIVMRRYHRRKPIKRRAAGYLLDVPRHPADVHGGLRPPKPHARRRGQRRPR